MLHTRVYECMHMQYACMLEHVGWLHLVNTKFNKLNFIPCKYSLLFWLSMLFYYNEAAFFTHHIKYNAKFNSMQCNTIIYNFICEWHENKNDDTFYLQRIYGYVKKIYCSLTVLVYFKRPTNQRIVMVEGLCPVFWSN